MAQMIMYSKFKPFRVIIFGYALIVAAGTFLLMLPVSSAGNTYQSMVDAFFTTVSAVTTTGLVVVDTGTYYSLFGQWVILSMIQVCGVGYMVFVSLIFMGFGRKSGVRNMMLIKESISSPTYESALKFVKIVIVFTVVIELLGTAVLFASWSGRMAPSEALYHAFFHSVSAFCTAGFSTYADSMTGFKNDNVMYIMISGMSLAGGIGFFVLYDFYSYVKNKIKGETRVHLKTHTKFVVITSFAVMASAFVLLYLMEHAAGESIFQDLKDSVFQVIAASTTTGFNTVDIGKLHPAAAFVLSVLMFIGAGPGSTAGGIKIISVGVLAVMFYSIAKGEKDPVIFKRKIPDSKVETITAIFFGAIVLMSFAFIALMITEKQDFYRLFFETMSAFGNGGLSTGITAELTPAGKIIISLTMIFGKIGPLALGYSLIGGSAKTHLEYPEAEIIVG